MENRRTFHAGDLVRHFKRERLDLTKPENKTRYLYRIIGVATHSETREALMIYQALYDDMGLFARPYDMFMEEVDHEKYPDIRQRYRFEIKTTSLAGGLFTAYKAAVTSLALKGPLIKI